MLSQSTLVVLCALSNLISALHAPAATQHYPSLPRYPLPRPTPGPYPHDLLRRQSASAQRTLLAAPDQTCGYFGGVSDRSWGCETGNCVFAVPTPITNKSLSAAPGSVLCCDPSTGCPSSPAPTACVDNYQSGVTALISGSADPKTLTCTSGIYVFCNTLTFATPFISAFFCNYLSNTAVQNATTTYTGQTAHSFTPTVPVFALAVSVTPTISSTLSLSSVSPSRQSPTATALADNGGTKVNKGAIVGAVIGGIAALVLVAALVVLFVRWRQEDDDVREIGSGSDEIVKSMAPRL